MYRIIYESGCNAYSIEQIRNLLEEALFNSISNRSLLFKLNSLRIQKKFLLILDNKINQKKLIKLNWNSILYISNFCKRIKNFNNLKIIKN